MSYKCVKKYVKGEKVKIMFVKSAEKDSNILTKNLSRDLHERHFKKVIGEKHE